MSLPPRHQNESLADWRHRVGRSGLHHVSPEDERDMTVFAQQLERDVDLLVILNKPKDAELLTDVRKAAEVLGVDVEVRTTKERA